MPRKRNHYVNLASPLQQESDSLMELNHLSDQNQGPTIQSTLQKGEIDPQLVSQLRKEAGISELHSLKRPRNRKNSTVDLNRRMAQQKLLEAKRSLIRVDVEETLDSGEEQLVSESTSSVPSKCFSLIGEPLLSYFDATIGECCRAMFSRPSPQAHPRSRKNTKTEIKTSYEPRRRRKSSFWIMECLQKQNQMQSPKTRERIESVRSVREKYLRDSYFHANDPSKLH